MDWLVSAVWIVISFVHLDTVVSPTFDPRMGSFKCGCTGTKMYCDSIILTIDLNK